MGNIDGEPAWNERNQGAEIYLGGLQNDTEI